MINKYIMAKAKFGYLNLFLLMIYQHKFLGDMFT